jgi:cyclin-dependent kinase 7
MKNISSGIDITAIRELKCLRELKSPNIISLVDVYSADGLLHMVLELCEATLDDIIREKKIFLTSGYIKSYMHMALSGVAHMHSSFVLHRGE